MESELAALDYQRFKASWMDHYRERIDGGEVINFDAMTGNGLSPKMRRAQSELSEEFVVDAAFDALLCESLFDDTDNDFELMLAGSMFD